MMKFSKKSNLALTLALTMVIANSQIVFAKNHNKQNSNSKQYSLKAANQSKITSIKNMSKTITQGEKFVLPTKVKAIIKGNTTKEVSITWNTKKVSTGKSGIYTFIGVVTGYNKAVTYKLTIKQQSKIASIKDLEDEVDQGEDFELPDKVTAVMTDKTSKQVSVTWNTDTVNTDEPGEYVFHGTVQGYSKKVVFKLTVNSTNIIDSIDDMTLDINQGEDYTLPETVQATMDDGTVEDVDVDWDGDVDVNTVGEYTLIGTVDGYDGQVILTVNVKDNVSEEDAIIESVESISAVQVKKGEQCVLPEKVTANMSDGTTEKVDVDWDNNVDTNVVGTYTVSGTIEGYDKQVSVQVIVTE